MSLIILRHGLEESANCLHGWMDAPMTDKGVEQAERAAAYLAGINFKNAYTSDLSRAKDTATIASRPHPGLVAANVADLRSLNLGLLQGKPYEEIEAKYEALWAEWKNNDGLRAPDGESFAEYQGRVYPFMFLMQEEAKNAHVLAVTHSHVCAYAAAVAMNAGRPLFGNALEMMRLVTIEPGNAIEIIDGKLSRLNFIS